MERRLKQLDIPPKKCGRRRHDEVGTRGNASTAATDSQANLCSVLYATLQTHSKRTVSAVVAGIERWRSKVTDNVGHIVV